MIATIVVGYSGWMIYRNIKDKFKGKCDSCSECSLNGGCPIQQLKNNNHEVKLHLRG